MTPFIKTGRDRPEILVSPQNEYTPANWPRGGLNLRLWRTTKTNVSIAYGVVAVDSELHLRRISWMLRDAPRKQEYEEVLDTVSVLLPQAMYVTLLNELRNIHFPAFTSLPIGLDGHSHGIELQSFPTNVSLSWWSNAPPSWREVEQWFKKVEGTFQKLLPPIPTHFPIGYRLS